MAELTHGGDVIGFFERYAVKPVDFSVNVNPLGVAPSAAAAIARACQSLDAYPDPLCRTLTRALSEHERVPTEWILCGNGAADLIWRITLAVRPKRVLIPAPSFSEYTSAAEVSGASVSCYPLRAEDGFTLTDAFLSAVTADTDMVFLGNPNNPTGRTVTPALLRRVAERCAEVGALLVVDECFLPFLDEPEAHTLKGLLARAPHVLLLRAFTKVYGLAGLRLGYCLCSDASLLASVRDAGQPWPVSLLAQAAGVAVLADAVYLENARAMIRTERAFLRRALMDAGCWVGGGEANFLLFRSRVPQLRERLAEQDLLIRDCRNFPGLGEGYYRACVRGHADNRRLVSAVAAWEGGLPWADPS